MSPLRSAVLVVGAVLVQVNLASSFTFGGARPEIVLAVVLTAGYAAGSENGAVLGFAAGLLLDLHLATPLGFTTLIYTLAGHFAGRTGAGALRSTPWVVPLVVAAGSGIAMVAQGLVGEVLGLDSLRGPSLINIVVTVSAVNLLMAPLAHVLVNWARLGDRPRRRSVYA